MHIILLFFKACKMVRTNKTFFWCNSAAQFGKLTAGEQKQEKKIPQNMCAHMNRRIVFLRIATTPHENSVVLTGPHKRHASLFPLDN